MAKKDLNHSTSTAQAHSGAPAHHASASGSAAAAAPASQKTAPQPKQNQPVLVPAQSQSQPQTPHPASFSGAASAASPAVQQPAPQPQQNQPAAVAAQSQSQPQTAHHASGSGSAAAAAPAMQKTASQPKQNQSALVPAQSQSQPQTARIYLRIFDAITGNTLDATPKFSDFETGDPLTATAVGKQGDVSEYQVDLSCQQTAVTLEVDTSGLGGSLACYRSVLDKMTCTLTAGADDPCCQIDVPMTTARALARTGVLKVRLFEGGSGQHTHHHPKLCSGVAITVTPVPSSTGNTPGTLYLENSGQQTRRTVAGCAEFVLPGNQWYRVYVQDKRTEPCGPFNFYMCPGDTGEIVLHCKPQTTRVLTLILEDECGDPMANTRFWFDGQEHYTDGQGQCVFHDPATGVHTVAVGGKSNQQQVIVGSADEQTAHLHFTQASTPYYPLTFEVEGFAEITEQVRIMVLDPRTGNTLHNLPLDNSGWARCMVQDPVPHDVVLKIGDETIQRERVTPEIEMSEIEESIYG